MLNEIEIPPLIDRATIPHAFVEGLREIRRRVETFQDRWTEDHPAQFVAADYELVFQALTWIEQSQLAIGRTFLEWGCGFAAVACVAERLGWCVYAVEAHEDLIPQARQSIQDWEADVELFCGNFLPSGSDGLAFDPTLPSLGHSGGCPYEAWQRDLDDFALVYSYPWPGEDDFHADVFDRYAGVGALLLMFIGPNEMRLVRKTSSN